MHGWRLGDKARVKHKTRLTEMVTDEFQSNLY